MNRLAFTIRTITATMLFSASVALSPSLQAQEPDWEFAGTIEIDTTQMAFLISGSAGGGTLEYAGKEYPFEIVGLGVGGIGIQTINAVGAVYNMDDVSKFAGRYVQARMGATLGKGKGSMRLSNQNGVILDLKASMSGAALSIGVDGMVIALKK